MGVGRTNGKGTVGDSVIVTLLSGVCSRKSRCFYRTLHCFRSISAEVGLIHIAGYFRSEKHARLESPISACDPSQLSQVPWLQGAETCRCTYVAKVEAVRGGKGR